MTVSTPWLSLRAGGSAAVYLWVPGSHGTLSWTSDPGSAVSASLVGPLGSRQPAPCPVDQVAELTLPPGSRQSIWELRLATDPGVGTSRLRFMCDHVYPFWVPVPGIVPSHFPSPEPLLRLAENPPRSSSRRSRGVPQRRRPGSPACHRGRRRGRGR
jgi:hypothetical protein